MLVILSIVPISNFFKLNKERIGKTSSDKVGGRPMDDTTKR